MAEAKNGCKMSVEGVTVYCYYYRTRAENRGACERAVVAVYGDDIFSPAKDGIVEFEDRGGEIEWFSARGNDESGV
jgi:hypothetical protein